MGDENLLDKGEFKMQQHKDVEFKGLAKGEFTDVTPWWMYILQLVGSMYVLFNGVITLMGLSWGFLKTVNHEDWELYIGVYGPLGFFLLYYLVFNNYYAQIVYYKSMKRNVILDYPRSSKPAYWPSKTNPFLFLVILGMYLVFMMYVFGTNNAEFNVYYVFISNLVIQIVLYWKGQQGIEDRLITLYGYVTAFKDKEGNPDSANGIDEVNLATAMHTLSGSTQAQVREPSYSHYMATWYWNERGYPWYRVLVYRALWLGTIVGIAMLALSMFNSELQDADKNTWDERINPCLDVCMHAPLTPCECIRMCKDAADQSDNNACQDAASDFYKFFRDCCK